MYDEKSYFSGYRATYVYRRRYLDLQSYLWFPFNFSDSSSTIFILQS